jgi:cell division cycle 20-like protein 1 (cofactor of APC complex)
MEVSGAIDSPYSLSPMSDNSQKLLVCPRKAARKISKIPFKVLEAPAIQDDFYLNLVDWSSLGVLAVGLSNSIYLWHAHTGNVSKLCSFGRPNSVTSVSWIQRGTHLAVGDNLGKVQIWDCGVGKKVREMGGHKSRIGVLAWNEHVLSSGGRDGLIFHRDVRESQHYNSKLIGHKQEVCGLKWSPESQQLASGGNDNRLLIWDARGPSSTTPLLRFTDHTAAIKAIAWSPYQRGLVASGGGTADRCIRFWNTVLQAPVTWIDTGSQVCNLAWSKNVNELVSTHGYSQNQIVLWSYPSLTQVATLTGHTSRVLYLAVSPDGQTIVTGASDETLRFWSVFPDAKANASPSVSSSLSSRNNIR